MGNTNEKPKEEEDPTPPPPPPPPPPDPLRQALLSAVIQAIPQPGEKGDISSSLQGDDPPPDDHYSIPSDGINGAMDYGDPMEKKKPAAAGAGGDNGLVSINPVISPVNTSTNINTNISYDKELSGDNKTVLNVLFTGLITGSAAMVMGESPLYFGSLGALTAAMTKLRSKELASLLSSQLPDSMEKSEMITPETMLLAGGVAVSNLTGKRILSSALILGAGAFLGPVL